MGQNSSIEWCNHTTNLWWGCVEVHEGCDNCLSPDTLVLKSDFNLVRIDSLKIGDKLISFNEKGKSLRRYELATVEKVWSTQSESIEITTNNSNIIASINHKFLSGKSRNSWLRADKLNINTALRYINICNYLVESDSYKRGYIAGATLGDGTMRFKKEWQHIPHRDVKQRYWRIAVHNSQTEFLNRIKDYISQLINFNLHIKYFDSGVESEMIKVETRKTDILIKIHKIIHESIIDIEFKRGWLAGMFDAEGNYSRYRTNNGNIRVNALRISQVKKKVLLRGIKYAKDLGFNFVLEDTRATKEMRIIGGAKNATFFLSVIKPSISNKINSIFGSFIYHKPDEIISLKNIGVTNLIDIQTSTGTFIANGLMTHNCYARVWSNRYNNGDNTLWGNKSPRKETKTWAKDLIKYNRIAEEAGEIHRVFVGSMMDIFEKPMRVVNHKFEDMNYNTNTLRKKLFEEIVPNTPNLMYLFLTKRPSNINKYIPESWKTNPPPNVMFGTSIVNQTTADKLLSQLLEVNGQLFLSIEPQLGEIIFDTKQLKGIDWVIVGGESGAKRRPYNTDWARLIMKQCQEINVPFFFKQIDKILPIPDDLVIREFPEYHKLKLA